MLIFNLIKVLSLKEFCSFCEVSPSGEAMILTQSHRNRYPRYVELEGLISALWKLVTR